MKKWISAIDAAPDAFPRSSFIGEEGPSTIAGEEEKCTERENEEREDDEGDVLGEVEAVGGVGIKHCGKRTVVIS